MSLTEEQKRMIKEYITHFRKYLGSEEYKEDMKERREREKFFAEILAEDRIDSMSEFEFGQIISRLWATGVWGNKEYKIQKIISENGLDKLRKELKNLLYGKEPFENRFDRFLENVKGLGPSSTTEILCFFNPKEYGIWNDKARKALRILGFERVLPLNKCYISGKEYLKFNEVAKLIAEELRKAGVENVDLLTADFFLYEVWRIGEQKVELEVGYEEYEFDHDEIRDYIGNIGRWLGFEVETEKTIGHGSRVDVVWRARIANLGVVTYVFEVHKSGNIDSLILNLQRALRNPTVQRIIAVSDKKRLKKIKKKVEGLPGDLDRSLTYWEVREVEKVHENLSEAMKSIEKLELVKSEFSV